MRLLLDINVLLDVLLQCPGEAASAALIGRCDGSHEAWLAWHSVATLAYLVERQRNAAEARAFIADTLGWAQVATTGHTDALAALDWPMPDLEDALQSAAAVACGAQYVITRNERDFVASPVPALSPEAFLARHPGG